jgi:uncharacterized hydrophobic protein (TIGR00271 family)
MKKAVAILSSEAKEAESLIRSMFMEEITLLEQETLPPDHAELFAAHERVIVSGSLELVKACIEACIKLDKPLAFLPLEGQQFLNRTFKIPTKNEAALRQALEGEVQRVDTLRCNGALVLQSVVVADVPALSKSSYEANPGVWERLRMFIRGIRGITLHTFTLTTAKEQEIKTAAAGIYLFEHDNKTISRNLLGEPLSAVDGKVFAVLVAPRSVLDYLFFLMRVTLSRAKTFTRLPDSIGYVKSSDITISSERPYTVLIDRKENLQTPVTLHVSQKVLPVVVGEKFAEDNGGEGSEKESIKVENLPLEKERLILAERPLPLFSSASEERYKNLFISLRDESRPTPQYLVLMVLSTLLATLGVFLDSASVVIGAMILAPLMAPMVSFSMGVLRKDGQLFYGSLRTIAVGVLLSIAAAALMTSLIPFQSMTGELAGRLRPSLLDLLVAIFSGIAAAFAKADTKIAPSLAGVAIAVALVPPLAVVGIGVGWMDGYIVSNALLLFLTNLVGIVLAATLTFLVLGYATGVKGIKSFWALGVAMLLIAIPLYFSFGKIAAYASLQKQLNDRTFLIEGHPVTVANARLLEEKPYRIRCDLLSSYPLDDARIAELKHNIEALLERTVTLEVRPIRVY